MEDAKFHRKPRDDGERNTRRRAEREGESGSRSEFVSFKPRGLPYIKVLFGYPSLITPRSAPRFLPLAFSFSCGISRGVLLVSHAVHEQS